jgi:hypothetical protein
MFIINVCLLVVSTAILVVALRGVDFRDANWMLQKTTFYCKFNLP